ncbi:MAG: hypothetical protein AAF798_21365 [Bacteroidota bacterium]
MKNSIMLLLISLCLLNLVACSKQDELVNPIRIELEQVIAEKEIVKIWATHAERCPSITSYFGTDDFEFMEHFIRLQDKYYRYDSLVNFEVDQRKNGNQMLLCFN